MKDRVRILREIDGIYTSAQNFILEWYAPYQRITFWNKFGTPPGYISRTSDYRDIHVMWWIDPDKSAKLEEALKDPAINLGEGPADDKYWLTFERVEEKDQEGLAK